MNPASGSADCDRLENYAMARAAALGKNLRTHRMKRSERLLDVLREAEDAEVFVAAGGDGTLAAVAGFAISMGKAFAAIPSGTANVYAAEHGIPKKMEEAVDLVLEGGEVQPLDVIKVGDRAFLCHVSLGTYSWITTMTPTKYKKRFGRVAYIWNTVGIMFRERIWTFELELDGRRLVRRASTIMVANAGSMGATGMRWGQNISASDGVVEVCVIRARTVRHYLALFWAFLRGKEHKHLKEYFFVEKEGRIHGPAHIPVRADGEKIAKGGFHFRVEKHAMAAILPRSDLH